MRMDKVHSIATNNTASLAPSREVMWKPGEIALHLISYWTNLQLRSGPFHSPCFISLNFHPLKHSSKISNGRGRPGRYHRSCRDACGTAVHQALAVGIGVPRGYATVAAMFLA